MLRQFGEHDGLITAMGDHNMHGGLDVWVGECTQWHDGGTIIFKELVAEAPARAARKAVHGPVARPLDQFVLAFVDLEFGKDTQLHGGARVFATHAATIMIYREKRYRKTKTKKNWVRRFE